MRPRESLGRAVQAAVASRVAGSGAGLTGADARELARYLAWTELESRVATGLGEGEESLSLSEEEAVVEGVMAAMFGLGPAIEALLADPSIEQIDINGHDMVWVHYADGSKEQVDPVAGSNEELVSLLRAAAARLGLSERPFDAAHPILDLPLPDGSRLSAAMAITAVPVVSIRRHRLMDVRLSDLVDLGTLTPGLAEFLAAAVRARANVILGGPTGAGKTTLLRAAAAEASARERLVTIEDDRELWLDRLADRHPDCVAMESRPANTEGEGAIGLSDLVRHSLRMAADRVILGEVRGGEVTELLRVMSQGRGGSMGTIHADSSAGVFQRLAMYAAASPERLPAETANLLISGAVDFVVYIDLVSRPEGSARSISGPPWRFPPEPGQRRVVTSVREVTGAEGPMVISNEIFRPSPGGLAVPGAPVSIAWASRLAAAGYAGHPIGAGR
ncbi:MAG: CpaF family protein [Acidimicrobiales bacterium]